MPNRKPVPIIPPEIAAQKQPVAGPAKKPKRWTFSFRNWSQIEDFGLSGRPHWYVSVFGRLRELGKIPVEKFLEDRTAQDARRYHEVDWNAKNIPVERADLTWVESEYLKNEADYPFVQFHVSKAVGRVIGFWDEEMVFNIVLFDPMHNLQPSKHTEYRVRPAPVLNCEFTSLLREVESVKAVPCESPTCDLNRAVQDVSSHHRFIAHNHEVLILAFMNGTIDDAEDLIESGRAKSLSEVFERGVIEFLADE
jgi:hypothetical protein